MNLLLTGAYQYSEKQKKQLEGIGYRIDFLQWETDNVAEARKYDVVVCNNLFMNNDIDRFTNLKAIQLTSVGMDRLPVETIKKRGIRIYNAGSTYAVPIAEFAVMRLLEIYKNAMFFYENQQQGIWQKNRSLYELHGKKAGILGFGNIAKEVAARLQPFGIHVTAINRSEVESEDVDRYVPLRSLYEILSGIDVLFICIALTQETAMLIDRRALGLMKNEAVIINVSRGGIIDELALKDYMNEGKFMGCALDVFSEEPIKNSGGGAIFGKYQDFLSPHIFHSYRTILGSGCLESCIGICRR